MRPITQKILLLLFGGLVLGLSTSPRHYFYILKTMRKDWQRINRRALHRAIRRLYQARLVDAKDNADGTTTIFLTEQGKQKALTYKLDEMQIPDMKQWDGYWRMIIFDIPEKRKKARDALARLLKNMNFYQLQKSVFVHPFECRNKVNFIIEFFNLRQFVRIIIAQSIDNELDLKKHFQLL